MAEALPNYIQMLKEMFPAHTEDQITWIADAVQQENPNDTPDQHFENMVNMLSGTPDSAVLENIVDETEGACGYSEGSKNANVRDLHKIFPDACVQFLTDFCNSRREFNINEAIDILTIDGYTKIKNDYLNLWEYLKEALPDADPEYLEREAQKLASEEEINNFITEAVEKKEYPTMDDYIKRMREEDKLRIYRPEYFTVDKFLEIFPNPDELFKNRKPAISLDTAEEADIRYALTFLSNHYKFIRRVHIERVFKKCNGNLLKVCDGLDQVGKGLKVPRDPEPFDNTENLALLQEISYLQHRKLIRRVVKYKNQSYAEMFAQAKKYNLLETCSCCFDDELIPEECFFCTANCVFCKSCVQRGVETNVGDGKLKFPCFNNCNSEFSLRTLEMVLDKTIFETIIRRLQSEEIKQANIEGVETCPFCDFAKPLGASEKIFVCENPKCAKESCRECRHESHIPKRCNEIEYDEDVKQRTFIENKMTEALLRVCYNCSKPFIKSSGCNKVVCASCGKMMCYICGKAINSYDHFGAIAEGRCPLYTNDNELNLARILDNVQQAKQELGTGVIKVDPSVGIEKFFQ